MSETFTKLFSSILDSTIWIAPDPHRLLWITMLAMADRKGRIYASIPGLANRARIQISDCEAGLQAFLEPDKYSRTPDNEGRRIGLIPGGWRLLNYDRFRQLVDSESVKESKRNYMRRIRAMNKNVEVSGKSGRRWTQAEAEAEAERSNTLALDSAFESRFWPLYPRKKSKGQAEKAWKTHANGNIDSIIAGLHRAISSPDWTKDNGKYIPYPATWLNAKGWLDEPHTTTQEKKFVI